MGEVTLVYSRRYEPQWLVDEMLDNLSWVDQVVCLDDRDYDGKWRNHFERVALLQDLAREAGAGWMLNVDPDERLESRAERIIRGVVDADPHFRFTFPLREMYSPTEYRTDGVWGKKTVRRLAHLDRLDAPRFMLDLNYYHLKHIEPANRTERRRVHETVNNWHNKKVGFAYLDDETEMTLEEICEGREYHPVYRPYEFRVPW